MTEDQIEREVERCMNHLDRQLMRNLATQDEYDAAVRRLDSWAKRELEIREKVDV